MKYTDEQIKNALECCIDYENKCNSQCPFYNTDCLGVDRLDKHALDLINRQEAEIKFFTKENQELQDRLDDKCDECIARDRAKAIKEFWDEVKKQSFNGVDCATNADVVFVSDGEDVLAEMVGEGE